VSNGHLKYSGFDLAAIPGSGSIKNVIDQLYMTENATENIAGIILAAGKGKRMLSPLPKVMHVVAGRPMLGWVLERLSEAGVKDRCVIVSPGQKEILDYLEKFPDVAICLQPEPRGTGDAVASTADFFSKAQKPSYSQGKLLRGRRTHAEKVVIATGDMPGVRQGTMQTLIEKSANSDLSITGMRVDPLGYGRVIVNSKGFVEKIVEEKDATEDEKKIRLCNAGLYFAKVPALFDLLNEVEPNNSQSEYYLTDCISLGFKKGLKTTVVDFDEKKSDQFLGINDPKQLKEVEAVMLRSMKV